MISLRYKRKKKSIKVSQAPSFHLSIFFNDSDDSKSSHISIMMTDKEVSLLI